MRRVPHWMRCLMIDRRRFLQASGATLAAASLGGCGGVERTPTPGVPRNRFDEDSTAEEVTEGVDLSGKLDLYTHRELNFEAQAAVSAVGAVFIDQFPDQQQRIEGLPCHVENFCFEPGGLQQIVDNVVQSLAAAHDQVHGAQLVPAQFLRGRVMQELRPGHDRGQGGAQFMRGQGEEGAFHLVEALQGSVVLFELVDVAAQRGT